MQPARAPLLLGPVGAGQLLRLHHFLCGQCWSWGGDSKVSNQEPASTSRLKEIWILKVNTRKRQVSEGNPKEQGYSRSRIPAHQARAALPIPHHRGQSSGAPKLTGAQIHTRCSRNAIAFFKGSKPDVRLWLSMCPCPKPQAFPLNHSTSTHEHKPKTPRKSAADTLFLAYDGIIK